MLSPPPPPPPPHTCMFSANDDVVDTLAAFVQRAKADDSVELETRIGTWKQNRFLPGVDRSTMDRLVRAMDSHSKEEDATVAALDDEWMELEDYFYTVTDRRMRTRVEYCPETMQMTPMTIEKKPLAQMLLQTHLFDIRVSLAHEIRDEEPVKIVRPKHVRIKQFRRYKASASPFVITCAMTWSGASFREAEENQATMEPTFEIECELELPRDPLYRRRPNRHIAKSLLAKNVGIMFGDNIVFTRIAHDVDA